MAISFATRGSNHINVGSGSTIDNYTAMTYLGWFYFTDLSANDYGLIGLGTFAAGQDRKDFSVNTSAGVLDMVVDRATTDMRCQCNWSPSTSTWYYLAMSWNNDGTLPKLYIGNLSTIAAEPGSYTFQDDGSGTIGDSTANNFYLGNIGLADRSLIGRIAYAQVYNRGLSAGEVRQLQFKPTRLSGCVLYTQCGYNGTGTQPDWSGNGNAGTVTNGSLADHVPIPPAFGQDAELPYVVPVAAGKGPIFHGRALGRGRIFGGSILP